MKKSFSYGSTDGSYCNFMMVVAAKYLWEQGCTGNFDYGQRLC